MNRLHAWLILAMVPAAYGADVAARLPIDAVTVYRDSAIVRRAGTVELPAGETRLVVRDLPDLLQPGDAIVVNDTRVIPARLAGRRIGRGEEPRIEATLHRRLDGVGVERVQVLLAAAVEAPRRGVDALLHRSVRDFFDQDADLQVRHLVLELIAVILPR